MDANRAPPNNTRPSRHSTRELAVEPIDPAARRSSASTPDAPGGDQRSQSCECCRADSSHAQDIFHAAKHRFFSGVHDARRQRGTDAREREEFDRRRSIDVDDRRPRCRTGSHESGPPGGACREIQVRPDLRDRGRAYSAHPDQVTRVLKGSPALALLDDRLGGYRAYSRKSIQLGRCGSVGIDPLPRCERSRPVVGVDEGLLTLVEQGVRCDARNRCGAS